MRFTVCTVSKLSLVSMPPTCGNPVSGITPPSFACTVRPHFLLHRYLNELSDHQNVGVAPFPLSLPWHPFPSAMVTKCFITCSCQYFHKYCLKFTYVIRIMITRIKMFKIVACFNIAKWYGDFWNCCLLFPASFKLA